MERLVAWQFMIFSMMFIGYLLYYYNRKSFSFIMPYAIEEASIDKGQLGAITSSIYTSYTISKFTGGILSDRLDAKNMFTVGLFGVGVLVVAFTYCSSWKAMVTIWFVQGFFQGLGWPACAKLLKKWFFPSQLGLYWSILSTSMNIAGGIGPLVASVLASSYGWRAATRTSGFIAIVMSFVCFVILKNSPSEVGLENIEISDSKKKDDDIESSRSSTSLRDVVRSPFLWIVFSYCLLNVFMSSAISDWGQLYLIHEKHHQHTTGSSFVSVFQIGAVIGSILAGYLTDKQVAKYGVKRRGSARFSYLIVTMVASLCALHSFNTLVSVESSLSFIYLLSFIMGFCAFGHQSIYGVLSIEHTESQMSGTAHAFASLGGGVGAVLAGYPLSIIAQSYDWYTSLLVVEVTVVIHLAIMVTTWNIQTTIGKRSV